MIGETEYLKHDMQAHQDTPELETYKKVKLLGKGSYGRAFLVRCGSDDVSDMQHVRETAWGLIDVFAIVFSVICSNQEDQHSENE